MSEGEADSQTDGDEDGLTDSGTVEEDGVDGGDSSTTSDEEGLTDSGTVEEDGVDGGETEDEALWDCVILGDADGVGEIA